MIILKIKGMIILKIKAPVNIFFTGFQNFEHSVLKFQFSNSTSYFHIKQVGFGPITRSFLSFHGLSNLRCMQIFQNYCTHKQTKVLFITKKLLGCFLLEI